MVNIIEIPDGSNDWGAPMRANLSALNTAVTTANTKANAAVNIANLRVRSVNGVFPDENGNVDFNGQAIDQTARDQAAAAQSTANSKYLKPATGIPLADLASGIQTSLGKAETAVQPAGLTKAAVGLSNVDNTTDLLKPISTATQSALDAKVSASVASAGQAIIKNGSNGLTGLAFTPAATGGTLVQRTATGQTTVPAVPAATTDATSKSYVDGLVAVKYTKPTPGIPDSDLASTFVKTINSTAPDANGNVIVTVEGGGYIKPSGGIPSSDMTTAVQTSLGKADSALQSLPAHTHTAAQISDASSSGRTLLTQTDLGLARAAINAADAGVAINTGTGLTGGGNLTTSRTLSLTTAAQTSLARADTSVQPADAAVAIGAWKAWNPTGYTSAAQYRLTPDAVQWRGYLTLTSGAHPANTANTVGQLPTEARPLDYLRLAWWLFGTAFAGLQINTTGFMVLQTGASANDTIYLSGLNYAR